MTQKPQVPQDSFDPDMTMHQANRPFDVQEQSSRRAMVLLIVASGFLLVLALVIFNVYQPGTRRIKTKKFIKSWTEKLLMVM